MPSFTLLGSGVIKRHYTPALRAWAVRLCIRGSGNGVFNRIDRGNWVEGLTTYLELLLSRAHGRRGTSSRTTTVDALMGYAVTCAPARQLSRHKSLPRSTMKRTMPSAINKAAMVFHALRREIGEAVF